MARPRVPRAIELVRLRKYFLAAGYTIDAAIRASAEAIDMVVLSRAMGAKKRKRAVRKRTKP